jgi:hypothetical protein
VPLAISFRSVFVRAHLEKSAPGAIEGLVLSRDYPEKRSGPSPCRSLLAAL